MGSAGASKADLKRDAQQRESEAKAAIKAEKDARVLRNAQTAQRKREDEAQRWQEKREAQEETRREREAAAAAAAGGGAGGGAGGEAAEEEAEEEEGESGALDSEIAALLEQPSAIALGEGLTSQLGLQDLFSGCPTDDDALLFAVPVCAPYSTLASYTYRAKLTPGAQKKGKAGKQALGMFAAAARSERHRELLRAVVDDDIIRVRC